MDDEELGRLAKEELLKEAQRGKARAETMGALGWQRCPVPSANKRFLSNMLMSTLEPKRKRNDSPDNSSKQDDKKREPLHEHKKRKKESKKKSKTRKHKVRHEGTSSRKSKHKTRHKSKERQS